MTGKESPLGYFSLSPHTEFLTQWNGLASTALPSSQDPAPHLTLLTTSGKAPLSPCQCFYMSGVNNDGNDHL